MVEKTDKEKQLCEEINSKVSIRITDLKSVYYTLSLICASKHFEQ